MCVAAAGLTSKEFGVDAEEFMKALCKPRVKVGTEWVNKGQTKDQVRIRKYEAFLKRIK